MYLEKLSEGESTLCSPWSSSAAPHSGTQSLPGTKMLQSDKEHQLGSESSQYYLVSEARVRGTMLHTDPLEEAAQDLHPLVLR